jgi:predicted GIY-YIG superfamily endonuclease
MIYVILLEENKWYVGFTNRESGVRLKEHINGKEKGGSGWCDKYQPIKVIEFRDGTTNDETIITLRYMRKYSWENVRGAKWLKLKINKPEELHNMPTITDTEYFNNPSNFIIEAKWTCAIDNINLVNNNHEKIKLNKYYCECCEFSAKSEADHKTHIITIAHLNNYKIKNPEKIITEVNKNVPIKVKHKKEYFCTFCDFHTKTKTNYTIHMQTLKHIENAKDDICNCEYCNSYIMKSALANHYSICYCKKLINDTIIKTTNNVEDRMNKEFAIKILKLEKNHTNILYSKKKKLTGVMQDEVCKLRSENCDLAKKLEIQTSKEKDKINELKLENNLLARKYDLLISETQELQTNYDSLVNEKQGNKIVKTPPNKEDDICKQLKNSEPVKMDTNEMQMPIAREKYEDDYVCCKKVIKNLKAKICKLRAKNSKLKIEHQGETITWQNNYINIIKEHALEIANLQNNFNKIINAQQTTRQ